MAARKASQGDGGQVLYAQATRRANLHRLVAVGKSRSR